MTDTAYEIQGKGPVVILVHGLGLNRRMWQWQLAALTSRFHVVTYDLIGHGDSPKPPGPYEMRMMTRQIAELMDELGLEGAALVGFSLGGLIVRAFALEYPRRVTALVIMNSAHARSAEQRAAIMSRVEQAEASGPAATVDAALERWFTAGFAARNPALVAQVRDWVTSNDETVYPSAYRLLACGDVGLEDAISGIACPVLVLTGEEDYGNSPEMARQMAGVFPDSAVAILPGLRHMALAEDPDAVNAILVPFLAENATE